VPANVGLVRAQGIHDAGVIVGNIGNARPVVWTAGHRLIQLNDWGYAAAINDSGMVVGTGIDGTYAMRFYY
jgi:hypothetical protein